MKFSAAIFDVDDTILDNYPKGLGGMGLHEKSRLKAVYTVAREMDIPELLTLTRKENILAFRNAAIHSMEGAVWNILQMKGLAFNDAIDYQDERLVRIVRLKNELHEKTLLEEAEEIPGAIEFIKTLYESGLKGRLAVASSAVRRDIDLFFGKTGLDVYFPAVSIMSKESVTHNKPHPESFEKAFASLGLDENEKQYTIAFEDDPRGIMSAKAAGLTVCAITHRFTKKELESLEISPDFIIESYEEAYGIVGLSHG